MFTITFLTDIHKNPYIGISITPDSKDKNGVTFQSILDQAAKIIPNFEHDHNLLLQRNKNSDQYHITIFNVMEYNRHEELKSYVGNLMKPESLEFKGIGSISEGDKITYFVVVTCEPIQSILLNNNFKRKDLHVTIAFNVKDLFTSPKNETNVLTLN